MASSGILRRVVLARTDVSEERSASIIRVTRIGELGTTFAVTSIRITLRRKTLTTNVVPSSAILVTLMMEVIRSSETSVITRATRSDIQDKALFIVTGVKASNLSRNMRKYLDITDRCGLSQPVLMY
jgi:hypothetical protein